MEDSTVITAGFAALLVGVTIMLVGVFLGGELAIITAGGTLMVLSVAGFVIPALGDDHGAATGAH
ncbi:hypothetical protein QA600_01580 [Natronococcus sp. A-GB1]|uniref:hypothetical protein n=1 Tax=Natronococcus sp. A-GB1 TaxID=3037648 RepID=UPI00241C87BF|nr:hypothetical protein [Natronococcus sp. A-GB1]MDG5758026.1 hypothetical protein [Natronococcus sp. A-GB1]